MPEQATQQGAASYQAFLVRLWQDRPGSGWRASAQSVQTGEITRFVSVPALLAFLRAHTLQPINPITADDPPGPQKE